MNRRALAIAVAVGVPLVLVGALVALRAGDGGGPRKLPVALGSAAAPKASGTADAAIAPWRAVRYEAGPDLPALEGTAKAYRLTAVVDADAARRVAKVFGVDGEPQESGGSFTVASTDQHRWVYLGAAGVPWFSYDDKSVTSGGGSVSCTVATGDPAAGADGTGVCVPDTTTIPPHPAGFPGEDEAKATALGALGAAGVRTDGAAVEAFDDGFGWQVTVTPVVDGARVDGMQATVWLDADGIHHASGAIGTVEPFDEYPLIGTAAAISHLNDGTDVWFGPRPMEATGGAVPATCPPDAACASDTPLVAPGAPCTTALGAEGGTTSGTACAGGGIATEPTCPPVAPDASGASPAIGCVPPALPPDTVPSETTVPPETTAPPETTVPPEPQVVVLTGATLGLTVAPGSTGEAYLVPTYVFTTADGPGPTALAIDASWIEPPAPVPVEPCGSSGDAGGKCATATDGVVPPGMSEVPCSTPGFSGPCYAGPAESTGSPVPPSPASPPTTCGPPVASADAPNAPADGGAAGCPIN